MFPPEIEEEILGHLWDDNEALKACALTRRSFLFPAQQLLYHKVVFGRPFESPRRTIRQVADLLEVLEANPMLCTHVRYLEIVDQRRDWLRRDDCLILRIIRLLDNLQALIVDTRYESRKWPFSIISPEQVIVEWPDTFLSAFLDVIHRPTLKFFSMTDFPMELMKHGGHLTHLSFWKLSPQPLPPGSCTSCVGKLGIHSLELQGFPNESHEGLSLVQHLRCLVDLKKIRRVYVNAAGKEIQAHHLLWDILQDCSDKLEELAISPCHGISAGYKINPSGDPIDWSTFRSLRVFCASVNGSDGYAGLRSVDWEDPQHFESYPWLIGVLDQLASSGNCGIEEIFIHVLFDFSRCDNTPSVTSGHRYFKDLELLSDETRFPRLKAIKFTLEIIHPNHSPRDDLEDNLQDVVQRLRMRSHPPIKVEVSRDHNVKRFFRSIFP
ncbi:hypothetical protein CVT26_000745 [Gymnopilus dilepis]|uniref:Uncharacterized protein n=1 Tax=Gymnopilus dilepis TaxID=231916 RepID=A0A409Y2J0_9AGAR|nr:hypothetical protein CVT26_000745 [Gymnopilus dilepis]